MMNGTVIIEQIDGFDVVIGFGKPVIDPIETRKIVDLLLFETDEYKAIIAKQSEMEAVRKVGNEAFMAAGAAERTGNRPEVQKQIKIYEEHSESFNALMNDLKEMKPALKNVHSILFSENAVYCYPKGSEFIKTKQEINLLREKNIPADHVLTLEGDVIADHRRKSFWEKTGTDWKEHSISAIGLTAPDGSKSIAELSESDRLEIFTQTKKEHIKKLSESDKQQYKENEISRAAAAAARLRSQLEIQSDPDALEKAKAEYDLKLEEINEMYK